MRITPWLAVSRHGLSTAGNPTSIDGPAGSIPYGMVRKAGWATEVRRTAWR
jgi:hypothetical protein